MTKFLVVFDVDSTLIQDEVIELLADFAGVREQVAEITNRAMSGELDFESSLSERVLTLRGLPESVLTDVFQKVRVSLGAKELIDAIHEAGGRVGAVSGGFIQVLNPLAELLSLDFTRANELEVVDGALTGRVVGKVVDRQAKRSALIEWAAACDVDLSQTIAVGDGSNDLDMMHAAGLSVAFNAKQIVKDQANMVLAGQDLRELATALGLSR
ncbi:MAG: phosphoserine phosphatase SerB [Rhodoluna sp.]|nr:phosphoserine phosphatase SerB [Rhodoluna sp.]